MKQRLRLPVFPVIAAMMFPVLVEAAPLQEVQVSVTLKDHRFEPASFSVPAGVKVRINLVNLDPATEEFDSHDLKVEQLVTPHGRASFTIGPLTAGAYGFMGEFHPATAQGRITVSEGQ